jgi:hypothetical protein
MNIELSKVVKCMKGISSSETSVHIRATRGYKPEDGNIHIYGYENIKLSVENLLGNLADKRARRQLV